MLMTSQYVPEALIRRCAMEESMLWKSKSIADITFHSRWYLWSLTGTPRNFNAIAFYLHITGTLQPWEPNLTCPTHSPYSQICWPRKASKPCTIPMSHDMLYRAHHGHEDHVDLHLRMTRFTQPTITCPHTQNQGPGEHKCI